MLFDLAATAVLLLHLAFILFAVLGAALTARWRWIPVIHLPAAIWASYIELNGGNCPLTDVENHFRHLAGKSGYAESFIEHYLLAIVYPDGLTRDIQSVLAGVVILTNIALYAWLFFRKRTPL